MKTFHVKNIYNQIFLHRIAHRTWHITFIIIIIIILFSDFLLSLFFFFISFDALKPLCALFSDHNMIVGLWVWYVVCGITTVKYIMMRIFRFSVQFCNFCEFYLFGVWCMVYVVCLPHEHSCIIWLHLPVVHMFWILFIKATSYLCEQNKEYVFRMLDNFPYLWCETWK